MLKLKLQYFGLLMQKASSHWKRPWCGKRLKAGGEGDDRVLDGWMATPTQWTWVWANSWRWWRPGKPGVLKSMGLQSDMTEQLNNSNKQFISLVLICTHTHSLSLTHTHRRIKIFISVTRILQSSLRFLLSNYQEMQYLLLETTVPPRISLEPRCQIEL